MAGKKRGNGEGGITQRGDDRWEARLTLPNGKRKSIYAPTRAEAARKLAAALKARDEGVFEGDGRMTCRMYFAQWLEMIKSSVEPGTWENYERIVRLHIVPTVGKTRLAALTPAHLQMLYAKEQQAGLKGSTIRLYHRTLHCALAEAVRLDIIPRNVAEIVSPPKVRKREYVILTPDQVRVLVESLRDHRHEAIVLLALGAGLRASEVLGLRWADVDLETGIIRVRQLVRHTKGGSYIFTQPKTDSSLRTVRAPAMLLDALRRHRARQIEQRLQAGARWLGHDLVICTAVGAPLWRVALIPKILMPALRRAGLPTNVRFHDLRHSFASLLLAQGVPIKTVSEALGHSSAAVTLGIYAHALPDAQEFAAATMQKLMIGNTGS